LISTGRISWPNDNGEQVPDIMLTASQRWRAHGLDNYYCTATRDHAGRYWGLRLRRCVRL